LGGRLASTTICVDSRYDLGEIIDKYETHAKFATAHYGFSNGLSNGWARAYSVGATYDDHQFTNAPDVDPALLAAGQSQARLSMGGRGVGAGSTSRPHAIAIRSKR
jgi:hypothetical protein